MKTLLDWYEVYGLPAAHVYSDIERCGVRIDETARLKGVEEVRAKADESLAVLASWVPGVNWRSPKQVAEVLYQELGLPLPPVIGTLKAPKPNYDSTPSTSAVAIKCAADISEGSDRNALLHLLEYKKNDKLASFYESVPKHLVNGRMHPGLAARTRTGRLSSSNPNLQNQPKTVRNIFVPSDNHAFVCLDYEGLEWRILAHAVLSRYEDDTLVTEIIEGLDPHGATAVLAFNLGCHPNDVKAQYKVLREAAKTLNYAINYGKGPVGLAYQIQDEDGRFIGVDKAREYYEAFFAGRPSIRWLQNDLRGYAKKTGYARSWLGRFRYLPDIWSTNSQKRKQAQRQALNTPIQATAADIVMLAMLRVQPLLYELEAKMVLQIHDELLFEVPLGREQEAKERISDVMTNVTKTVNKPFLCPLGVSGGTGMNWTEAGK